MVFENPQIDGCCLWQVVAFFQPRGTTNQCLRGKRVGGGGGGGADRK